MKNETQFWDQLAIKAYNTVLKKSPSNALAHKNLGIVYNRIDQDSKAIRSFRKAIKHEKGSLDSYYHLAKIYEKREKNKKAIGYLTEYENLVGKSKGRERRRDHSRVVSDLLEALQQGILSKEE